MEKNKKPWSQGIWAIELLITLVLFFGLISSQNIIFYNEREVVKKDDIEIPISASDYLETKWNRTWGGIGDDIVMRIVIDSNNNTYLTGTYNITGTSSLFLLKYNNKGELEWSHIENGLGVAVGNDLALDSSENIYVVGWTSEPYSMYPSPLIFLLKYNSSGDLKWSQNYLIKDVAVGVGIEIDSSDNIYLIGGAVHTYEEYSFLLKCNSSGFPQWNRTWSGVEGQAIQIAYGLVLDSSNNIYLVDNLDYQGPNENICLVKFNSTGDKQWNRVWDSGEPDFAFNLAIDSSENIYISGITEISGNIDMVLLKYSNNGDYQWKRTWGGVGSDYAYSLTIDSSDNIYLGGTINNSDISIVKYDVSGEYKWDYSWGGLQVEYCTSIELDLREENLYIAGGTEIFGHYDSLIVKLHFLDANEKVPSDGDAAIPLELIILTSVIGAGAVIGVASVLLIRRKRKNLK